MVEPRTPGAFFSLTDYYQQPKNYVSRFQSYLPFLTALINGIYWDQRYPRLVSKKGLRELAQQGPLRLQIIGDISCDIHGSIECTETITTPENPFLTWQPLTGTWHTGLAPDGVSILAVDHLPAELPRAASTGFSQALCRCGRAWEEWIFTRPLAQCGLPEALQACDDPP
jgi:alpha-aminoadipic semialdehyde synthase